MTEHLWPTELIHHAWDLSLQPREIVDAGVWNVGFTMPLFGAKGGNR